MRWAIAKGERGVLARQTLAISSVIALLSGGLALGDLIVGPSGISGSRSLLGAAIQQEWSDIFTSWAIAVGAMVSVSSYVMGLRMVREMKETRVVLVNLGSAPPTTSGVLLTRLLTVATLAFALGLSMGVVAAQVAYRGIVVFSGSFYSVPTLGPIQVAEVGAISLVSCLLGGTIASLRPKGGL